MTNGSAPIVPLGDDRADEAVALIGRAFQDDPWAVFSCADPDVRALWLPWCFWPDVWQGRLSGVLLGTAGRLEGVAAAVGPGGGGFSVDDDAQFGHVPGRAALGAETWDRIMVGARAAYRPAYAVLERAVPEPHWYLDTLAVEPTRHGQGLGSHLLQAVHAHTDADGLPITILTFQPKNLPLYRRHGYVVICGEEAPAGRPPWWGMRRPPGVVEGG
jgi:GNAT superfamily N-acetyltransferase